MGADYFGQERAIKELQGLSNEAKKYLSHHLRNSLNLIIFGGGQHKTKIVEEAVWHIVEDLKKIGC